MSDEIISSNINNEDLEPGSSHRKAVPIGDTIKTTIERGNPYMHPTLYNVEITLLQTVRGNEAWERVKAQGVTDESPKVGFEYILTKIRLGYFRRSRGGKDEPYTMTEDQFVAVSSDGKTEYEIPHASRQPEPALIGYTFKAGESREGWILLEVSKDEKKPLLIYKRKRDDGVYGIWGHVWLQLY